MFKDLNDCQPYEKSCKHNHITNLDLKRWILQLQKQSDCQILLRSHKNNVLKKDETTLSRVSCKSKSSKKMNS